MGLGIIVNLMLLANAIMVVVAASRGAEFFIYSGRGKDGPTEEAASVCFFHWFFSPLLLSSAPGAVIIECVDIYSTGFAWRLFRV